MNYNLIISSRAEKKIDILLTFLLEEWGISTQQSFLDEFQHCLFIIKQNPYTFPATLQNTEVRQCVITSLSKLFYTIQGDDILILSLEDVRMDPNKMIF